MPKSKGFTLIELLITISIIGILSAIGLVAYSTVMKQGRDSKRQSDLRSIQSALEQYYADQFFYPSAITFGSDLTSSTGNPNSVASPKTYFKTIPNDLNLTYPYVYVARNAGCNNLSTSTNKCSNYCLYAKLENSPSPVPTLPAGCTYPAGYNFAVIPP